jgi:hypothetical protein
MKPVDPLAIQVGQRRPVLGQGQRLGFEAPQSGKPKLLAHRLLGAYDLAHDGIEGETVGIVDILVDGQPPIDRPPE